MKITNLAHVSYRVTDTKRALKFYRDILGLKLKFTIQYNEEADFLEASDDVSEGTKEYFESFRKRGDAVWITYLEVADHQYLELFANEDTEKVYTFDTSQFDHIGYLHLALEVEDIFEAYEEIKKTDVRILSTPGMGVENTYQFWILDPDGNAIELMQYTDKSWQLTGK